MEENPMNVINRKIAGIKKTIQQAPKAISVIAVNHFKQSFQVGGFIGDNGIERWKPLKNKSRKNIGRAILIQKGALMNSIREMEANQEQIKIGSSRAYASIQNNGGIINQAARSSLYKQNRYKMGTKKGSFKNGTTAGQGFTHKARIIKIPARKFMGNSRALTNKIDNWYLGRLKQNGVL